MNPNQEDLAIFLCVDINISKMYDMLVIPLFSLIFSRFRFLFLHIR